MANVVTGVAEKDESATFTETVSMGILTDIGPADGVAVREKDVGESAHPLAADTQQMHVFVVHELLIIRNFVWHICKEYPQHARRRR